MARNRSRRREASPGGTPPTSSTPQPTFGWVPQPPLPSIDELVANETYAQFGVTRDLLEAKQRLVEYMASPETLERAAFERRPGRVGPEVFAGAYIGPRLKEGRVTEQMCVVGMVDKKVRDHARISESVRLDRLKDQIGADIDVVPVGRVATVDWDIDLPGPDDPHLVQQQNPPIMCGTSIGPRPATGTFGGLVLGNDDRQYLLSNNHVLAGVSGLVDGFAVGLPIEETEIKHPGPTDDPDMDAIPVGKLARPVPRLNLSSVNSSFSTPWNTVDAAIAKVHPAGAAQYLYHYLVFIRQDPLPLSSISRGTMVKKVGRTTGLTFGQIIGVEADTPPIAYIYGRHPLNNSPLQAFGRFAGVLVIQGVGGGRFSNRGDSGSIVMVDSAGKSQAVGLLFAGGSWNGVPNVTFAIPMTRVFETLGIARFINDE